MNKSLFSREGTNSGVSGNLNEGLRIKHIDYKMTPSKDQLRDHLEKIIFIAFKASLFYADLIYLENPSTKQEIKEANETPFIQHVMHSFFILVVLEICKLYDDNKNQDFNLFKTENIIFEMCKAKTLDISILKELHELCVKRDEIVANNDIKSLIKLRDEFYAHTDRNPAFDIKSYRPKYDQIKILIDFGFNFGNSLYFLIFKETWLQPSVKFGKASNVLEDMILAREYRIKKTLGEHK